MLACPYEWIGSRRQLETGIRHDPERERQTANALPEAFPLLRLSSDLFSACTVACPDKAGKTY